MLIAGDIGGTKTDLAIYSMKAGPHAPLAQSQVHSADYPSLQAMVSEFLGQAKMPVYAASFDVAGPVIGGRAKVTNLPWVMDAQSLASDLKLNAVHLMNDLEAVARAVPVLRASDLITINAGDAVKNGPIAIIAPGTGLGESFLTWNGSLYIANSSEGGHSDFAPTDERQIRMLKFLLARWGHVSVERVCSGIGIPNIYEFLRDEEEIPEQPETAERIASSKDRTKAIVEGGLDPRNPSELCRATIEIFISILASEAGNLALKVLATGGIYLAGGVALHLLAALQEPGFMHLFTRKGRFEDLMQRMPVHVINRARRTRWSCDLWTGDPENGKERWMNNNLPSIYLARHSETAWTVTGQHTGVTDLPLTERGECNAGLLGKRLSGLSFAKVFTSPLKRAMWTCELAGFGSESQIDRDLVEWNYGEYEGRLTVDILAERPGWELFRDGCPGGESPQQVAARADRVLERVRGVAGDVLLFSSGHFLRILAARWTGLEILHARSLMLGTASLSALGYEHSLLQPVIRLWNDTHHVLTANEREGPASLSSLQPTR